MAGIFGQCRQFSSSLLERRNASAVEKDCHAHEWRQIEDFVRSWSLQVWLVLSSLLSTAFLIATISSACLADMAGPDDGAAAFTAFAAFALRMPNCPKSTTSPVSLSSLQTALGVHAISRHGYRPIYHLLRNLFFFGKKKNWSGR